jgi:hypothetical protein
MSMLAVLTPGTPATEALGRVLDAKAIPAQLQGVDSSSAAAILEKDHLRLAAQLVAGWLSTRESVWWGCLCSAQLMKVGTSPGASERLQAVLAWVKEPGDARREAIGPLDDMTGTPVDMLAQAVAFTTDNLSPNKDHPVACPTALAHRMVAQSVLLAIDHWPGPNKNECLAHFVELGLDVAEGQHMWTKGALPLHPGLRRGADPTTIRKTGKIWENW